MKNFSFSFEISIVLSVLSGQASADSKEVTVLLLVGACFWKAFSISDQLHCCVYICFLRTGSFNCISMYLVRYPCMKEVIESVQANTLCCILCSSMFLSVPSAACKTLCGWKGAVPMQKEDVLLSFDDTPIDNDGTVRFRRFVPSQVYPRYHSRAR